TEETAEARNIPLGGGIGGQHLETLADFQIPHGVVQHHDRLRAEQAAGVELGIGGRQGVGHVLGISCIAEPGLSVNPERDASGMESCCPSTRRRVATAPCSSPHAARGRGRSLPPGRYTAACRRCWRRYWRRPAHPERALDTA